jgi:hypothetical protein
MKTDAHKAVLKPSDFKGESDEVTSNTTSTEMDDM